MSTSNSQKNGVQEINRPITKGVHGETAGLLCPDGLIAQCLYLVKKTGQGDRNERKVLTREITVVVLFIMRPSLLSYWNKCELQGNGS
jgi:hypothetical protein